MDGMHGMYASGLLVDVCAGVEGRVGSGRGHLLEQERHPLAHRRPGKLAVNKAGNS